jgi:hypothetical protein
MRQKQAGETPEQFRQRVEAIEAVEARDDGRVEDKAPAGPALTGYESFADIPDDVLKKEEENYRKQHKIKGGNINPDHFVENKLNTLGYKFPFGFLAIFGRVDIKGNK